MRNRQQVPVSPFHQLPSESARDASDSYSKSSKGVPWLPNSLSLPGGGRPKGDQLPMYTADKSLNSRGGRAMKKVPIGLLVLLGLLAVYVIAFSSSSPSVNAPVTLSMPPSTSTSKAKDEDELFVPAAGSNIGTFDDLMSLVGKDPGKYLVVEPHFGLGNR